MLFNCKKTTQIQTHTHTHTNTHTQIQTNVDYSRKQPNKIKIKSKTNKARTSGSNCPDLRNVSAVPTSIKISSNLPGEAVPTITHASYEFHSSCSSGELPR